MIITICPPNRFQPSDVANDVWMAPVHLAGSLPRHRPSDLLITHYIKKNSIYTMVGIVTTICPPNRSQPNQAHPT